MNVNELRIGNYVNLKDKGLYKIDRGYDLEKIEDWEGTDYCTPIPLTEDWLLKFGFDKKLMYGKHNKYFYIKDKLYYCEHDFYSFVFSNNQLEINHIKHVHQLQNLYFALTQKELTIN